MTTNDQDRPEAALSSRRSLFAELGVALLLIVVVDLFALRFVAAERTLYRADQLAYWTYASRLADDLRADTWTAMEAIAWSVAHSDLNLLPAAPVAVVLMVFGASRSAYLLAVLTVYGLAVVVALWLTVRLTPPTGLLKSPDGLRPRSRSVILAFVGALLLFPTLWRPVFIGYLGLGGVALGLAVLAVYFHVDFQDDHWKRLALAGFLAAILSLFRRWYTLWTAGFFVMVMVDAVWSMVRGHGLTFRRVARTPLIVGVTAAATILVLAAPITFERLGSDYSEEFAAFTHHGSFVGRAAAVVGEFGLLSLGLVAAAAVVLFRGEATRRIGVLLPLHAILTYLMMIRVQDHSSHHWYLYLASFLMLVALAVVRVMETSRRGVSVAVSMVVLGAGVLTTAGVFATRVAPAADLLGPLVPRARVRPVLRADIEEVERLLELLDRLTTHRPGYVYVLGCSGTLSEQTLAFANRSLETDFSSPRLILRAANVDRRDGFPSTLLDASYVVVPDPVQINMRPEDQQVVVMPTHSFLEGRDIAQAFLRLPESFELEGGVKVSVFERERPNTREELEELSNRLRERYPERPDIYLPK